MVFGKIEFGLKTCLLIFVLLGFVFLAGCPGCGNYSVSISPNPVEVGKTVNLSVVGSPVTRADPSNYTVNFTCSGPENQSGSSPASSPSHSFVFSKAGTYSCKAWIAVGSNKCQKYATLTVKEATVSQCECSSDSECAPNYYCDGCNCKKSTEPTRKCTSDAQCVAEKGPGWCCNSAGNCYYCGGQETPPDTQTPPPSGASQITIIKGTPVFIDFAEDETQRDAIVKWTIANVGNESIKINSLNQTGCSGELSCSFLTSTPLNLGSMNSVVVEEKVVAQKPAQSTGTEIGLNVSFSVGGGASTEVNSGDLGQDVGVFLMNRPGDKFHSKLEYADQNFCIGFNGVFGRTGERARPRVLLSWDWVDFGLIECDKESSVDDEFLYCDPTQFSIELARKLHEIEELEGRDVDSLTSFKAFLIADNYSDDLQRDFAYYYGNSFFETPEWFGSVSGPWKDYFEDPNRLKFEDADLESSGLYQVDLGFSFDVEEWRFFESGLPVATITVRFSKLHDAGVEVPDSPFYHLPFNGLVGTLREDASGKKERADYGLGFINESGPIALAYSGSELVGTAALDGSEISGPKDYSTESFNEFAKLNQEKRGVLLEVDTKNSKLSFLPGRAVPVVSGIKSHDTVAESFYSLFEGGDAMGAADDYVSFWNGFASSDSQCGDFYGNRLFQGKEDGKASVFSEKCVPALRENTSFGFKWIDVINNQYLFQKSVFYLPLGKSYSLKNACNDQMSVFAANGEASSKNSESVSLDSLWAAETIGEVIELIGSKDVCVHSGEDSYLFYWNEQRLEDSARDSENAIESELGVNLGNFACTGE